MPHRVTLIPGDGIGPEVAHAARRCLDATGVAFQWDERPAGEAAIAKFNTPLPEDTLQSVRDNTVAIKGPITTPIGKGFRSVNVALRKQLNLFACLRPCRTYDGVKSPFQNVNLVIVRENTEDLYAGIEFEAGQPQTTQLIEQLKTWTKQPIQADAAISIKPISATATERITRFAMDYAVANGRKKVTAIHKANIMKFTDGLFMAASRKVAEGYAGRVAFEDRLVDATCMQLVLKPQDFDVLVLPNLYGDILSDLCAGLIGGLGIAPGANIGEGIAVFEAVHGSAPKYAGLNKVNPTAMILSGVMMLKYLKEEDAARKLERAVEDVLREGKRVTYDLKASKDDSTAVGTKEMADAIIERMKTVKVAV